MSKKLGPPKGAEATLGEARSVLGARFREDSDVDTHLAPISHASHTAVSKPHTPVSTPHAQEEVIPSPRGEKPKKRSEPPGMTRKTYYLTEIAAKAVNDAVAQVHAATGGRLATHEALSALLIASAEQAPAVAAKLREQMLGNLSGESGM